MNTIWKFPLRFAEDTIRIPERAKFLSAQKQGDTICAWFLVEPDAPTDPVFFRIIGTGATFDASPLEYLATVQDGVFVWHLFVDRKGGA